jgi:hypothetical protein
MARKKNSQSRMMQSRMRRYKKKFDSQLPNQNKAERRPGNAQIARVREHGLSLQAMLHAPIAVRRGQLFELVVNVQLKQNHQLRSFVVLAGEPVCNRESIQFEL